MPRTTLDNRPMSGTERARRHRERQLAKIAALEASLRDVLPDAENRLAELEHKALTRTSLHARQEYAIMAQEQRARITRAMAALGE